jgi:hypothetical protein
MARVKRGAARRAAKRPLVRHRASRVSAGATSVAIRAHCRRNLRGKKERGSRGRNCPKGWMLAVPRCSGGFSSDISGSMGSDCGPLRRRRGGKGRAAPERRSSILVPSLRCAQPVFNGGYREYFLNKGRLVAGRGPDPLNLLFVTARRIAHLGTTQSEVSRLQRIACLYTGTASTPPRQSPSACKGSSS